MRVQGKGQPFGAVQPATHPHARSELKVRQISCLK